MNEQLNEAEQKLNPKDKFLNFGKKIVNTLRMQRMQYNEEDEEKEGSYTSSQTDHVHQQFKLEVSSNSSDNSISLSPNLKSSVKNMIENSKVQQQRKAAYMDTIKEGDSEQTKAIQNWKKILKQKNQGIEPSLIRNINSSSSNALSPQQFRQFIQSRTGQEKLERLGADRVEKEKSSSKEKEKCQVNFLRGLKQNTNLRQNEIIDEFYESEQLVVKMQVNDLINFLRLQHEAQELSRRQNAFAEQQSQYFHLTRGEKILESERKKKQEQNEIQQKKFNKNWFVGISLAKRFLKRGKKKKTTQLVSKYFKNNLSTTGKTIIKLNEQEIKESEPSKPISKDNSYYDQEKD